MASIFDWDGEGLPSDFGPAELDAEESLSEDEADSEVFEVLPDGLDKKSLRECIRVRRHQCVFLFALLSLTG